MSMMDLQFRMERLNFFVEETIQVWPSIPAILYCKCEHVQLFINDSFHDQTEKNTYDGHGKE